ncbi:MAG: hypothetical protein HG446_006820 [Flavobacteriaceae bacterium]|jgi:hypothetical protein|nr:hypothetical protein [Flavobacteriaceae bacterium]
MRNKMGKIKNFQDLKNQKEELRAEIKEIESVLSFENPRKSFGVITNGVTEKYLGGMMDSSLAQNAFFLAEKFLFPSLKVGSAKLLSNVLLKRTKPSMKKTLIGLGVVVLAPVVIMRIKKILDNFQQRETAKSLSKLI